MHGIIKIKYNVQICQTCDNQPILYRRLVFMRYMFIKCTEMRIAFFFVIMTKSFDIFDIVLVRSLLPRTYPISLYKTINETLLNKVHAAIRKHLKTQFSQQTK